MDEGVVSSNSVSFDKITFQIFLLRGNFGQSSPLHFIGVKKVILGLFDMLELEAKSTFLKNLHKVAILTLRIFFLYGGGLCQSFALLLSRSLEETIAIMALNFSYINAQVKGTVFLLKRREIRELWTKLNDRDFKTKRIDEWK